MQVFNACRPRLHVCAKEEVDTDAIKSVLSYGKLMAVEFQSGAMRASSGIALPEMGGKASALFSCGGCLQVRAEMRDW